MNSLAILERSLTALIALDDEECAIALHKRMLAFVVIDEIHELSYAERGVIAIQFKERQLWKLVINPNTGEPFVTFTAWIHCPVYLKTKGRSNFEAYTDMKMITDVPWQKLIEVPKGTIKLLPFLSPEVRTDPEMLQAAKNPKDEFERIVDRKYPGQHLDPKPLKQPHFSFSRSEVKVITDWIQYAIEHGIARNKEDAIAKACETCFVNNLLDERIDHEPVPEERRHDTRTT